MTYWLCLSSFFTCVVCSFSEVWYPVLLIRRIYSTDDCSGDVIDQQTQSLILRQCAGTYRINCAAVQPRAVLLIHTFSLCDDCSCQQDANITYTSSLCIPDDIGGSFIMTWTSENSACQNNGYFPTDPPEPPSQTPTASPTEMTHFVYYEIEEPESRCVNRQEVGQFLSDGSCAKEILKNPDSCLSGKFNFPRKTQTVEQTCECCYPQILTGSILLENTPSHNYYHIYMSHRFNPGSELTSYVAEENCGPRGQTAEAKHHYCQGGTVLTESREAVNDTYAASINGCNYLSYSVYECTRGPSAYDPNPSSTLPMVSVILVALLMM